MSDHEGTSSVGHSTAWDHTNTWRQTDPALDGPNAYPRSGPSDTPISPSTSGSPPPRSSVESPRRPSTSKYRDSIQVAVERAETASFIHSEPPTLVEPNFDESVLRSLCDLDCGVPLLLDRIKQSAISAREAAAFFKRRSVIEGDYGRDMLKLARTSVDAYSMNDGKAGTFVDSWHQTMRLHERMAENRIRFAQRLNEMSDELTNMSKEVDKNRKQTKELAVRYERALQEAESATEKSKARVDATAEELERVLLQKEGESSSTGMQNRAPGGAAAGGKRVLGKAMKGGGLLLKGRNPANIQRQEGEVRMRMANTSDVYRKLVTETQAMRQEYFNFQLPRILRALKECTDEIDLGTQYHLTRYAFLFESIVLGDGSTLAPPNPDDATMGLKATVEGIDNRADFKQYMHNYVLAHGGQTRGPRREGPPEAGFLPPLPTHVDRYQPVSSVASPISAAQVGSPPLPGGQALMPALGNGAGSPTKGVDLPLPPPPGPAFSPTFGVDLSEQMARDNVDVPPLVERCCEAIERHGLLSQGIYRLSGTMTKVNKLREKLDRDLMAVDLDAEEWASDINNVASVLKLWLRELPEPLLTFQLHAKFIDAAKNDDNRLRHIRLHEQVNELPDANYATLRHLLGHLHKITQYSSQNLMTIANIATVFGPTLFGINTESQPGGGPVMVDTAMQNKAVETILDHFTDIFVDETESQSAGQ